MNPEILPILKSSLDFCVYIETIVKGFEKYSKYTIGVDVRNSSKEILFAVHTVIISENKKEKLIIVKEKCENMKMLLRLTKELQAFKSFTQFEHSSKLLIDICKQMQGWMKKYA